MALCGGDILIMPHDAQAQLQASRIRARSEAPRNPTIACSQRRGVAEGTPDRGFLARQRRTLAWELTLRRWRRPTPPKPAQQVGVRVHVRVHHRTLTERSPVKQNDLLTLTSLVSVLLLALHISQDIVFGMDRAGLNQLVGVAILLVIVCGAVPLRERRLGKVIMLLGGLMAAGMLPLHMRHGLRPEFLEKNGALLFIWTLYVLGVTGAFTVILAIQALRGRRVAS